MRKHLRAKPHFAGRKVSNKEGVFVARATPPNIRAGEKQLPPPTRRFIGDLSDMDKVLVGLDLQPRSGFQEQEGNE
jgi:hypothetical protein